jgi:hypothetical protein
MADDIKGIELPTIPGGDGDITIVTPPSSGGDWGSSDGGYIEGDSGDSTDPRDSGDIVPLEDQSNPATTGKEITVISPIKVITSGNEPAADTLSKGELAYGKTDGNYRIYINDGETDVYSLMRPIVIETTLLTSNWAENEGTYSYAFINPNFKPDSVALVRPDRISCQTAQEAQINEAIDVEEGSITIHANNLPNADVEIKIIIL